MNQYSKLTHLEKMTLIAELSHCLNVDDLTYLKVRAIIKEVKEKGRFDKVRFGKDLKIVA